MNKLKLSECKKGKDYFITEILTSDIALQNELKNLGFLVGEKVTMLASNYGKKSFLVKVMGINFAVDKKLCDEIMCYE